MTLAATVTATEAEVIRVYEVMLPEEEASALTTEDIAKALAVPALDSDYVDIFPVSALDQFGLKGYMTEGLGIRSSALKHYEGKIVRVEGFVVVVLSKAFKGKAVGLKNGHPLRLIGAFREGQADSIDVDLSTDSAAKQPPKKQKSQAAQSGMVATVVLLLMFAFVALIVWIA